MADTTTITPFPVTNMDGMFGGNGLIGGLILGSLLRNNGNFFGPDGSAGGVATQAGVQSVVNQSAIQQDLGDIKAAVPLAEASLQAALGATQNALSQQIFNSLSATQAGFTATAQNLNSVENNITSQLNNIDNQVQRVENAVQTSALVVSNAVRDDGDKTRALITQQYEATLNRQLSDANAKIVALENKQVVDAATRGVEVNTTNNINQMQQQQQQQAQFNQLANLIWGLGQYIRNDNSAINVGSGTQTSTPTNTNTNIR